MLFFNEDFIDSAVEPDEHLDDAVQDKTEEGLGDAVIADKMIEELSTEELGDFVDSEEAEELMECGIISESAINRIRQYIREEEEGPVDTDKVTQMAALNIAKNENDPEFDEVVALKQQLDAKVDQVVDKYEGEAKQVAESVMEKYYAKVPTLRRKLKEKY